MQTRRLVKAVAGIVCCLVAYAGAISLSAQDQALAFRAPRAAAPALASVYPTSQHQTALAQSVTPVVKATIASAR
ncbi:MAG: hypothetical protein KF805_04735 [Phycisphaeraceae bacterium]|nr:hypothetical protein [Phycisphaeraceae bacterium]